MVMVFDLNAGKYNSEIWYNMTSTLEIINALMPILVLFGFGLLSWFFRGTLGMMVRMLIADYIDRERNLKQTIYETQTVERQRAVGHFVEGAPPDTDILKLYVHEAMNGLKEELRGELASLGSFVEMLKVEFSTRWDGVSELMDKIVNKLDLDDD